MHLTRLSLAAGVFALAAASMPAPSPAAGSGIAFDSVTKFTAGSDSPPEPGNFQADFETAANPPPPGDSPKMPFGLGKQMGKMAAAMAMFKTGTAEHHYDAGNLHRIDHIVEQTAEITDCGARTLTTLNMKDKTYTVVSLDHPDSTPRSTGGTPGKPGTAPSDDGTKVAIVLTTKSLGNKTLDGTQASGYDSDVKTTVTKANGDAQTFNMETTAYYSGIAQPSDYCSGSHYSSGAGAGGGGAAMMSHYQEAMRALRTSNGNPRVTVSSSGPTLPSGKLALFELVGAKGERGGSFNILIERGNVHSVGENDAVFGVPAGYTKVSS